MIITTLRTNIAIQAITFATSVLIARILGPIGRGELALVLLYPQLVAGIAFLGIDRAVAVLGGRGELVHPVRTVAKLVLLFSVPAMAAGYATVDWRLADAHLASLATVYLVYVPAMYFFLLVVSLLNGIGDFARFNLTRLCFYVFNLAAVFAIWVVPPKLLSLLDWVVVANLASVYGVLAVAMWMLRGFRRPGGSIAIAACKSDVRAVFSLAVVFALPVTLAQFSNSAYQMALEHFLGAGALGFFVVFFSYSRLLSPLGNAAGFHVFHLGVVGENRDITRIFRLSLLVYLGCAVPLWLFAGGLIPMIFGRDFVVDGGTVGLLFISSLFALLADSMAEYLNGQRKATADTVGRIIYLVALGIACVWFVPRLGLVGMALAVTIGDLLRCGYIVKRISAETGRSIDEFWGITWADLSTLLKVGKRMLRGFFAWR